MWLIAIYAAIALPRWVALFGGLAVLHLVCMPFLLRYLKRDIDRRTIPSHNHPDIGL
jgi:hypothetical protein